MCATQLPTGRQKYLRFTVQLSNGHSHTSAIIFEIVGPASSAETNVVRLTLSIIFCSGVFVSTIWRSLMFGRDHALMQA